MKNIFMLETRNSRKGTIMWTIIISAVILFLLAFFPSMQTESMQRLSGAKMEGIDPAVLAALGVDKLIDFTVVTNYFGYVLQFIILAIMVYVTQRAVSLLVKEETDGTIEYLYAKPISRYEIFFGKLLSNLFMYVTMLTVFAVVTVIGYLLFSDFTLGQSIKEALIFYGAILFVGIVFMSAGIFLSSLMKSSKGTSGITTAIVFGTFVLGMMSALIKGLDFMIYFSPMDWIKTQKLMADGILPGEWIVGIAVIAGCVSAACVKYGKKDFLV